MAKKRTRHPNKPKRPSPAPISHDTQKEALLEEEENLSSVLGKLDKMVAKYKSKAKGIEEYYRDYHPVDIEGRTNRSSAKRDIERSLQRAELYESRRNSPYYARIDLLDADGDSFKVLIGEEPISFNGEQVVADWRSEIGSVYRNKQQLKPTVKERQYTLMLRRAVEIDRARVKNVVTEYDSTSTEAALDVVDPFLISVLRDKRRQYKLTNIIRTIQQKQNQIMELPLGKSFVVQGCAGSGKTMILLHRLSYLAFNEPNVDFSRYVIVTPSDTFNEYVDDLSAELGIERIPKYTVESYYKHLIEQLSSTDVYTINDSGQQRAARKVEVPRKIELDEDHLDTSLLKELYSKTFLDSIAELTETIKRDVLEKLAASGAIVTFESQDMPVPSADDKPFAIYGIVSNNERRIRDGLTSAQTAYDEVSRELAGISDSLASELERLKRAEITFSPVSTALAEACKTRKAKNDIDKGKAIASADGLERKRDELASELTQRKPEYEKLCELITALESGLEGTDRAHMLLFGEDDASRELAEAFAHEMPKIEELIALEAENEKARQELSHASKLIEDLQAQIAEAATLEQSIGEVRLPVNDGSPVARAVREQCREEISAVEAIESELDALGVLAFGRRRRLAAEAEEARRNLESAAREALAEFRLSCTARINDNRSISASLAKSLEASSSTSEELSDIDREVTRVITEELDNLRSEAEKQKMLLDQLESDFKSAIEKLEAADATISASELENDLLANIEGKMRTMEHPDYTELLPYPDPEINDALEKYQQVRNQFSQGALESLNNADERISFLQERQEKLRASVKAAKQRLDEAVRSSGVDTISELSAELDIRNYLSRLDDRLKEIYSKHDVDFDDGVFYRHRLLAILALCAAYYAMRSQRALCVSVDEAQDLSLAEYKLLRSILDNDTIFNLYGDTSQLVCDYRGIDSWDDVAKATNSVVFELNENYRNTLQVTDFCNRELLLSMIGVGLEGPDVEQLNMQGAFEKLFVIRRTDKLARIAIIHKRNLKELHKQISDYLNTFATTETADEAAISLIDVEASKGLEFEAVLVIEDGMTTNERYVAYTRAIRNLIVLKTANL